MADNFKDYFRSVHRIDDKDMTTLPEGVPIYLEPIPITEQGVGTGPKAFCAGGDVRSVLDAAKKKDILSQAFFREEYQLNHLIGTLTKPYIALLNGITMGGGVGLSVHGRYRVATEKTIFAMPETALGLFPDVGGGYFLPRLPCSAMGNFLALTGHRLTGPDVLWVGVATHYIPSGQLTELKENLCHTHFEPARDGGNFEEVYEAVDKILNSHNQGSPSTPESLAPHVTAIEKIFALFDSGSPVTIEDIIEKLKSYSKTNETNKEWSEKCINNLSRMSPTSLKITLRQLQEGSKLSFVDNFKMEYRMSQHCAHGNDFAEGVRAILIDKDNKPKWNPDDLAHVTPKMVDSFFTPIPDVADWSP